MTTIASAPSDLSRRIRRLELATRRLVDARFAGEYRSIFKGQGMEFAEVREYVPGDEVRAIDWNVTARMGRPFVRQFVEERELTVFLVVDVSGSAAFGSVRAFKRDQLLEMASALTFTAVRHNDRVGVLAVSDRVELARAPRKGRRHALRVVRELLTLEPVGRGTDLPAALDRAARLLTQRAVVFVCSDFQQAACGDALARLARRHDVIAVTSEDPAERHLPDVGVVHLSDPETDEVVVVDTGDPRVRQWYADAVERERTRVTAMLARSGVQRIALTTADSYEKPLVAFFRQRTRA